MLRPHSPSRDADMQFPPPYSSLDSLSTSSSSPHTSTPPSSPPTASHPPKRPFSRVPLPKPYGKFVVSPLCQYLVSYMVRCKISLWLQEFEDEYQLFTGWEQAAEDWAAFVRLWDAEEPNWDQVKYQLDRVEWMQANIAWWSLLRRSHILLFTSSSLPSTLAGIEELELRDLVKLADFPDFFDDIEQKWVPASHVLDMAKRKASRPPPAPPDPLIDIFALHLPRTAPTPLHPHTPLDPPSDFHVRTVSTDLTPKEIAEVVRRKQHSSSSSDTTKVEAGLKERKGRRGSDA